MQNPRHSGQPRVKQAALIPATSARQRLSSTQGAAGWQEKVRRFDLDGPGVLGYYLDTVALLASLCPLVPEVRTDDGDWVKSDDAVLHTLLSGYRSSLNEQPELIAQQVRHREAIGEAWIIHSEDIGWNIVTAPNVKIARSGDYVEWMDMLGTQRQTPRSRVWKSWVPDPYSPWESYSPIRRALPDLRRLAAATRSQTRGAESRLLMNGLLAFPDDGNGSRPLAAGADAETAEQGIDQVIDDYIELAKLAFRDDDAPSAAVPFPYIGQPAVPVELGRGIDGESIQVEEKALEAFARAVNFPAQLLTVGPGAANHWNEWVLQEVQHQMGLAPKLQPVCNDLTTFYLRPMVAGVKDRVGQWDTDPSRIRVGYDMTYLTSKPDKTANVLSAWTSGLIDRDEAADILGIERPLPVPEGMDPYEHWELATGKPGAPYAEVDNGKLTEAADVFADGGDTSNLPVVEDPEMEGDLDMSPSEEEEESGPLPDALLTGMAANEMPPTAPPQLAAATDVTARTPNGQDYGNLDSLTESLFSTDAGLEAGLTGASQVIIAAVITYVAKEIIKAHPSRGPKRAELRGLPLEQVWIRADDDVRSKFDLEQAVAEAVAEYEDQLSDQFDEAETAVLAALVTALILGDEEGHDLFRKAAATAVITAMLAGFVVAYFNKGKPSQHVSPAVARVAMSVAGGAVTGADGLPQRSPSGVPVPGDGGQWQGNTGMATGNNVVTRVVTRTGRPVSYRWVHGFLRKPAEPFIPHLELDGHTFANAAEIPGGVYPGDHPNCTCVLWLQWHMNGAQ